MPSMDVFGEEFLEMRFDSVLDETGIDAEVVARVREHLSDRDDESVAGLRLRDRPDLAQTCFGLLVGRLGHLDGARGSSS